MIDEAIGIGGGVAPYPWAQIFKRAGIIALVLGGVLTLVNQSGAVLGDVPFQILPTVLVFLTPFLVVSISQVLGIRAAYRAAPQRNDDSRKFLRTLFDHGILLRAIVLGLTVGGINTLIVVLAANPSDQLPLALVFQGITLPILFGAISQTLTIRRVLAQFG